MTHHCFQGDNSRFRPPSVGFECSETMTDDNNEDEFDGLSVITFTCTLPDTDKKLSFACREPSCGVLINGEMAATKPETGAMDPNFFDAGYTLAGRTGFQVWPGSRLLVEALMWPYKGDCDRLQEWQERLMNTEKPLHVIELGAGVGMVGSCLANSGAHVVMTDLPTLVAHSIEPNLIRNSMGSNEKCPEWLQSISAVKIGHGWAAATSLDWTVPVEQQISTHMLSNIDVVVASDCVWLVSMLDALLDTVAGIFRHSPHAKLLMSFQRRDSAQGNASSMFTTVDRVLADIKDRGWTVDCLTWRQVVYNKNDGKEVFVFEIGLPA